MTFASAYEAPPAVWGVGRVVVGDEVVPWAVSEADIDADTEYATTLLAGLGLAADELVLIVSLLSQAIHVAPFERAAATLGALYSSADASRFDAFRTASLVRQLRPTVVLGVDTAVLDGFEDLEHAPAEVFTTVRAVIAGDAAAHARLQAAGVDAGLWLRLGPLNALSAPGRAELDYDAGTWNIESASGAENSKDTELVVTGLTDRCTPCDGFRTGVAGRVVAPGRLVLSTSGSG